MASIAVTQCGLGFTQVREEAAKSAPRSALRSQERNRTREPTRKRLEQEEKTKLWAAQHADTPPTAYGY